MAVQLSPLRAVAQVRARRRGRSAGSTPPTRSPRPTCSPPARSTPRSSSARSSSSCRTTCDVRHQRRLRLRVRPAQPPQGRRRGRAARPRPAPRRRSSPAIAHVRARSSSCSLAARRPGVVAGARGEPLRRGRLLGARAALQGAAVPRLAHVEHALRQPRGLRARARGRGVRRRSCSRCSPRSSAGAWRSHAFGAVQDVVPDREGGIASIATVLGARADRAVRARHVGRRRRC